MSIKSRYVTAFARETGRFAVWEPGDPADLGDYGVSSRGLFRKLGNVAEFGVEFRREATTPAQWQLTSEGVATAIASAAGAAGVGPVAGAQAGLHLTFRKSDSLFVRAGDSVWTQIANVREVAGALQGDDRWDFGWRLVAGVRRARSLLVVLAETAAAAVTVVGDLPALRQLQAGTLAGDTRVSISSEGAFTFIGSRCPLLMGLAKVRRFPVFGSPVKYSLGDEVAAELEPFAMLDSRDEVGGGRQW